MQAETYLRLLAEAELRQPQVPAEQDRRAGKVWFAATMLTAVGAIDPDTARHIVTDFEAAAALRPGGGVRLRCAAERPFWTNEPPRPASTVDGLAAVPVGESLLLPPGDDGWFGELWLTGLVRCESYAVLSAAMRWTGQVHGSPTRRPSHALTSDIGAVDELGNVYQFQKPIWWNGRLWLDPVPPREIQWLEIGPGIGGFTVRVDLTAAPTAAKVLAQPVPQPGVAGRMADLAAEALLLASRSASLNDVAARAKKVIRILEGGGALPSADPARLRLAALARWLEVDVGIAGASAGELPEAWASVLTARDASDGQEDIAPLAVVLPHLDGTDFALSGLRTSRSRVVLSFVASGRMPLAAQWPPTEESLIEAPPDPSFSWQLTDSTGRWHIIDRMSWGYRLGVVHAQAEFVPPLPPDATWLKVIVTGTSERVGVTVPLSWRVVR
jgi:hypothetical protein